MNGDYRYTERRATNWLGTILVIALLFAGLLLFSAAVDALSGVTTWLDTPANPDAQIVESP